MTCPKCGMRHQCVCAMMTPLDNHFDLLLIQHPNELARATNSAKLLQWQLTRCASFTWDRRTPPVELLEAINNHANPVLLFPTPNSQPVSSPSLTQSDTLYIVLDATWQEAGKMWRQSPWLQALPTFHLELEHSSEFTLRRNQKPNSVCTCEIGIELLKLHNQTEQAHALSHSMKYYFAAYQADRSGHALRS